MYDVTVQIQHLKKTNHANQNSKPPNCTILRHGNAIQRNAYRNEYLNSKAEAKLKKEQQQMLMQTLAL